MKALGVVLLGVAVSAATAGATRSPSLRALSLTPPTFRGSSFKAHERVKVSVRGAGVPSVHTVTDGRGRFRVRLAGAPSCRAWTVRAIGVRGGIAVYRHARCAALKTDVDGLVRRGPTMPVCSDQAPCTAPDPGVTVKAFQAGSLVADTTTDDQGHFSFSLADGDYTFKALGRGTEPETLHVETVKPVHLAFVVDTGIR